MLSLCLTVAPFEGIWIMLPTFVLAIIALISSTFCMHPIVPGISKCVSGMSRKGSSPKQNVPSTVSTLRNEKSNPALGLASAHIVLVSWLNEPHAVLGLISIFCDFWGIVFVFLHKRGRGSTPFVQPQRTKSRRTKDKVKAHEGPPTRSQIPKHISILHICHNHHNRWLCKTIQSSVKFSNGYAKEIAQKVCNFTQILMCVVLPAVCLTHNVLFYTQHVILHTSVILHTQCTFVHGV